MIQIAVTNWTSTTLSFQNAKAHGNGATPTASPSSIGHGATMTVTVTTQPLGGGGGSFRLSGSGVAFTIDYGYAPNGQLGLEVTSRTFDYLAEFGQPLYQALPGANLAATVNLYKGVTSGTKALYGYAVPLGASPYAQANNCADLANSVYGPHMRQTSLVSAKFEQSPTVIPMVPADFTGGQMAMQGGLVDTLFNALVGNTGADGKILNFLANYLLPEGGPAMRMWVPALRWGGMTSTSGGLPMYELREYILYAFAQGYQGPARWQMNTAVLKIFLSLLASGAHFVAISADADFTNQSASSTGSRSLLDAFVKSGLSQCRDPGNSHYCDELNLTGRYYLDISHDWAPPGSGLLLALLFGSTVNARGATTLAAGTYNTFMQLEGWQETITGSKRHGADYSAHKQSLWNFSTYGASPYSEKRGLTVFLAPSQWTPQVYSDTLMMPYVGACPVATYVGTPPVRVQGPAMPDWFDASVIEVPDGTQASPPQYTVSVYQS